MSDDIEIIVNDTRPGFVDYTFKKGNRKVYLFETRYSRPYTNCYAVYVPRIAVYRYFYDTLLSAQAYSFEILNEPCWAPIQGPGVVWIDDEPRFWANKEQIWRNW